MKVRGTIAGRPLGAKLTALCWGALILFAPAAVSACTSSSSTSTPTVFTPSVTTSPTGTGTVPASSGNTPSGSSSAVATPGVTSTATSTVTAPAPHTATATVTETVTASQVPSAAPVTGGGGTAGFQDILLLGLGAAAILAGVGSIAYRRRLTRHR